MQQPDSPRTTLLAPGTDPAPVERIPATRRPDLLFVCEHAGRQIPHALASLGLPPEELDRHIAWDIGAEAVARHLATNLGAGLILQRYSRLVIDCNRPPRTAQSIPEVSDGTIVPGNADLPDEAITARIEEIFRPYADACASAIADPRVTAAYSIHSFTPRMDGRHRPWQIGFCHRARHSGASALTERFRAAHTGLVAAENQPYQIDDETDWFIPRVAEPRGVAHALIEIRNDQIANAEGQAAWATRLANLFQTQPECP